MGRPNPGQRRERRVSESDVLYLRCWGPFHEGEWMPCTRFTQRTPNTWATYCSECWAYIQVKRRGGDGVVRLTLVRKWIWEVVHRCGGMNAAARTLGINPPTLFRWLGRYKGYENKRIHRKSVQRVLETLAGLRNGTITPDIKKNGGRIYKYGCKSCGGPLNEETPGCSSCWERLYRKELRSGQGNRRERSRR